jgi:hypothetical protein
MKAEGGGRKDTNGRKRKPEDGRVNPRLEITFIPVCIQKGK